MYISSKYQYYNTNPTNETQSRNNQIGNHGNMPPPPPLQSESNNGVNPNKSSSPLQSLIDSGTITSEQDQAIKSSLEQARMNSQSQNSSDNNTSTSTTDPLDSLVSSGIITTDQKNAVKSTLESSKKDFQMMRGQMPPPPKGGERKGVNPIENTLSSLVSNNTITSMQSESILSAFEEAFESKTDISESDTLESLVTSGLITSDQKAAISSTFENDRKAHEMGANRNSQIPLNSNSNTRNSSNSYFQSLMTQNYLDTAIKSYKYQSFDLSSFDLSSFNKSL